MLCLVFSNRKMVHDVRDEKAEFVVPLRKLRLGNKVVSAVSLALSA